MLFLFVRQAKTCRTASGISRVSRWTFLAQTTMDCVSFAGHITFAILAEGRTSLSLVAPAFLACILFTSQAVRFHYLDMILPLITPKKQLSALIYQIQGPEAHTPLAAPPPQIQNTTPPPSGLPTGTQQPTTVAAPTSFLAFFIHHIRTDPQARMCKDMTTLLQFCLTKSPRVNINYLSNTYHPRNHVPTAFVNLCRQYVLFHLGPSNHPIRPSWPQQWSFQKLYPGHHHLSFVKRHL